MVTYNEQLSLMDINSEYAEFVEKFKPKKTTDDCYTPDNIYEAVAEWVCREYGIKKSALVRPFWPGSDYERFDYPEECVVLDNPPFSILAKIINFYLRHGISFFLFAPALTCLSANRNCSFCAVAVGAEVTYENGAKVRTSFVTNLEKGLALRSAPELFQVIQSENESNNKKGRKELPEYNYPDHVVTAALCQKYSKYGIDFCVSNKEAVYISELDAQRACGKKVFGGGLLLSERAAAERAAAERAAAERAAAERAVAERSAVTCWELSPREKEIVNSLKEG